MKGLYSLTKKVQSNIWLPSLNELIEDRMIFLPSLLSNSRVIFLILDYTSR